MSVAITSATFLRFAEIFELWLAGIQRDKGICYFSEQINIFLHINQ